MDVCEILDDGSAVWSVAEGTTRTLTQGHICSRCHQRKVHWVLEDIDGLLVCKLCIRKQTKSLAPKVI